MNEAEEHWQTWVRALAAGDEQVANDFWDQYGPEARAILDELLEKYAAHGAAQFVMPDVLEVPPISNHGNVIEIAGKFGGEHMLAEAVNQLQTLLYAP